MKEYEFRQRAALAALPECIRLATGGPITFNIRPGEKIITDESMHNAAYLAAKIADSLFCELKKYDPDEIKKKQAEEKESIRWHLNSPVGILRISTHAANLIESAGYKTVADVVQYATKEKLLSIKGVGGLTVTGIEDSLERWGLWFGCDISEYMEAEL